MPTKEVRIAEPANGGTVVPLDIKPQDYVDQGTDEDTGHGRKRYEGQSIHGDTVSRFVSARETRFYVVKSCAIDY